MSLYFKIKQLTLLVATIVLLGNASGCAVSEKTCLSSDWQTLGHKHGKYGKSADALNRYVGDCAGYGVTPDANAYSAGYKAGIVLYCTAENGETEGRHGKHYSGACPADLEKPFLENYVPGLQLAVDQLEMEHRWDSIEVDRLRRYRTVVAANGTYYTRHEGRIEFLLSRISRNTQERSAIYSSIRKWSSRI